MMLTQAELEQEMVDGGRAKVLGSFNRNEEAGTAHNNPYASAVYRRFVVPLADMITAYVGEVKRGVAASGKALLRAHDPMLLAVITVRTLMDTNMQTKKNAPTSVARMIGQTIYGEALLEAFENVEPDLYYTLVRDFERRMTKSERHRLTVFKMQAEQAGVPIPAWSPEDKLAVGTTLIYLAREAGLIVMSDVREGKKTIRQYAMAADVAGMMDHIKGFVAGIQPISLPCVEPPRDWVTANDGGYHTEVMRRVAPCCIRGRPKVEDLTDVPEVPLRALNVLQRRPWRINADVLETVDLVGQRFDVGEVLAQAELPKPKAPEWLDEDMTKDQMHGGQLAEFAAWKVEMREWYTENKSRGVQWGRYYEAIRVARQFKDVPFWFVYQYDYRGRAYANTRGVSPQGSDLQKALLRAAEGKPITTAAAKWWFYIAGANRFGFDKATLQERFDWTVERSEMICAIASDPLSNRQWTTADNPFQFLAWCFEFAQYTAMPESFLSHLALGQDGSCNGLQHFSAMLRDEVGGRATNLMPSATQQDIYRLVAEETSRLLASWEDPNPIADRWKRHRLSRDLVKRSVMTLPYGSTRFSCSDFIFTEYMSKHKAPEFERTEYKKAARWLSVPVWDAIGNVVVKAREAMAWLQNASDELIAAGITEIVWRSPSGFVVRQRYGKSEYIKVETRLSQTIRIRPTIRLEKEEPCPRRHRNGIAPNFIHSCDAAHMHLLICWADDRGLGHLAFIHDDYGTTADGTPDLHIGIRETFVGMYRDDCPLTRFRDTYGIPDPLPERGDLDLEQVLESTYFFA